MQRRDVHGGRRLADAALLVGDRVNRAHRCEASDSARARTLSWSHSPRNGAFQPGPRAASSPSGRLRATPARRGKPLGRLLDLHEHVQMTVRRARRMDATVRISTSRRPSSATPPASALLLRRRALPRQSTSAPPSRSRAPRTRARPAAGQRSGNDDVVRARSLPPLLRPRCTLRVRCRSLLAAHSPSRNSHSRRWLSTSVTVAAGSATASAQPGESGAGAQVGDRLRRPYRRQLQARRASPRDERPPPRSAITNGRRRVLVSAPTRPRIAPNWRLCRVAQSAAARPVPPAHLFSRETVEAGQSPKWGDDEIALWLIALAVRLHTAALAQVFVDDPSLRRGQRVKLHGPPVRIASSAASSASARSASARRSR